MSKIKKDPEAKYAHPEWWINAIKKAWPEQWEKILEENNAHPPLIIRVNAQRIAREDYLEKLQEEELISRAIPETSHGILLETPVPVSNLPGFSEGVVSVQDGAAQLAMSLLDLQPEHVVLDACAAPGGKLTHILEQALDLTVTGVEKDQARMGSIKENLERLQLKAKLICDDVANVDDWWDGQKFDRILLDAPCSASGVIRRHPDIKLLRQPSDISNFAKEQKLLLKALWPTLKPGGLLVYATCSIFPAENVEVIQSFLNEHYDAEAVDINAEWGIPCEIGRQILPGMLRMDGFYYAVIRSRISL